MKYFNVEASRTAQRYEISEQNFSLYTENKPPFEKVQSDGETKYYGICPSCLNPVRLNGLYKCTKRSPYGSHAGKDVDGFPKWDLYKYQHCPFAKSNDKKPINSNARGIITEDTVELYNLLKTQFDRVVYIISKDFGIRCSDNFWRSAIKQFCKSEGYCYPWLTDSNLPYMFAFFGLQQQNPYNQRIIAGSDLYNALRKYPRVDFDNSVSEKCPRLINRGNQFVNLCFRLTDHRQRGGEGDELTESIKFCIDDIQSCKTVFETRIKFSETYFINLINKKGNDDKRQQWLLDIAEECMPPLSVNS